MNEDLTPTAPSGPVPGHLSNQPPVRMRGPADMAEMLPYLLGFFPDDSIVAVGLQGPSLHQGGVIRIDIPDDTALWESIATDTARLLVELSEQRDRRPDQVLLYLCRDPADGDGRSVVAALKPLAQYLAQAFGDRNVVVKESLCVSAGRWWSFLCEGTGCCDPKGVLVRPARTASPAAAAATFAGLAPRGSRKSIVAGLAPIGAPGDAPQRVAIERAGPLLLHEMVGPGGRQATLARTVELLDETMAEFQAGAREVTPERAARLLVGLQDKMGRDRAAEYAESEELGSAQRLWRFLAQRCVPPFEPLAVAPLTLLAWTSWLADDSATARVVLARALDLDPEYTLAQLLYESLNGGLLPDQLLDSVRQERAAHREVTTPPVPVTEAVVTGAPVAERPLSSPPAAHPSAGGPESVPAGHRLPGGRETARSSGGVPEEAPEGEADGPATPGPDRASPGGASAGAPSGDGDGDGDGEGEGERPGLRDGRSPGADYDSPSRAADPGERRQVGRGGLRSQVRQAGRRLSDRLRTAGPGVTAAQQGGIPQCGADARRRAPRGNRKPV
ncbi:DUF4192 domain-containing protein [Saccharothrix sp. ST-888]|uniref:DUF4192 domain-containing protein n=1 Tax=Saccharothrix sp. ST-888 TaxID=1427391 RepID=UPI000AD4AFA0|nr:DUF4192 domain-containing protein [Saccharothrix sp. ST-888]